MSRYRVDCGDEHYGWRMVGLYEDVQSALRMFGRYDPEGIYPMRIVDNETEEELSLQELFNIGWENANRGVERELYDWRREGF